MDNPLTPEFGALINRYCDGTLDAADHERFNDLLLGNRAAQRYFHAHLDLHARLCWEANASTSHPMPRQTLQASRRNRTLIALAAALLVVLTIRLSQPVVPGPLVTVTKAGGRWAEGNEPARIGEGFTASVLDLAQGFVELTFRNGAVLLLEAPTRLEVVDTSRTFLHSGRVVARVSAQAIGFAIDTSQANLVDLGTEFGVSVGTGGDTQVQVFEGAINAEIKSSTGKQPRVEHVVAGQACAIDASTGALSKMVAFEPARFVRKFPTSSERRGPSTPFNHSQFNTISIVRADTPPTIDADLADWDRSRAMLAHCVEPYADHYFVEAMMAYDAERLYVAAHVGDPAPMHNRVDPKDDPDFYWAGGSVLVRLAADRSFGWPLDAQGGGGGPPGQPQFGSRPQDIKEQIAHVGLWYSRPQSQAQLRLDYGMDCHGRTLNPPGWQGAFHKDEDGLGYTLEYAIPWSLLHANPPKPGDVWPASWTVHWSDHEGRTCMGQLVEVTNPSEKYLFVRGPSWGKAIFE